MLEQDPGIGDLLLKLRLPFGRHRELRLHLGQRGGELGRAIDLRVDLHLLLIHLGSQFFHLLGDEFQLLAGVLEFVERLLLCRLPIGLGGPQLRELLVLLDDG